MPPKVGTPNISNMNKADGDATNNAETKRLPASRVRLKDFDPSIGLDRGASRVMETCWYLIKMRFFLTAFPYPSSFKSPILRLFGAKIGKRVTIKPGVNIHMPWKLEIGDDVWIGDEVFILNFERLRIDSVVTSSFPGISIYSGNPPVLRKARGVIGDTND